MSGLSLLTLALLGGCQEPEEVPTNEDSFDEMVRRVRTRVDEDQDFYLLASFEQDYPGLYAQYQSVIATNPNNPFQEGDCEDTDALTNPGMTEVCDEVDNNCDGVIDEGVTTSAFVDFDGDGFGDQLAVVEEVCDLNGYSLSNDDCDDNDVYSHPTALEVCDEVDNNCDGVIDEGVTTSAFVDVDGDGFGDQDAVAEEVCDLTGYSLSNDDCDDAVFEVNPGATEDLNLIGDEDCDGRGQGSLADADSVFEGDGFADYTGFSMANVGDMTGDGVPDVLVGAPSWSGGPYGPGEAVLVSGHATNFWDIGSELFFTGEVSGDHAGAAVLGKTDLSGDGSNVEITIGAPYQDTNGAEAGAIYSFWGNQTTNSSMMGANHIIYAQASLDLGGYVLLAGDLNNDGYDDLVTTSATNDNGAANGGEAYIVYGPLVDGGTTDLGTDLNVTRITGQYFIGLLGTSAAIADFDGDGNLDLAVGESLGGPSGEGAVYVFEGPIAPGSNLNPLTDADATLLGENPGFEVGAAIAAKPGSDLTGDGIDDLVIGSRYHNCGGTDSGAVYVDDNALTSKTLSSSLPAFICGDGVGDEIGDLHGTLDVGDLQGDGVYDLLIGNQSNGTYYGAAFLFMGPVSGSQSASDAEQILTGEVAGAGHVGRSAVFIDDTNGDGILEIGLGDPMNGASAQGRSYIIDGSRITP